MRVAHRRERIFPASREVRAAIDRAARPRALHLRSPRARSLAQTRALLNQERGFTLVIVVHEASRVVGYYGLAPTAVVPAAMPRFIKTGQPPNLVPCLLLGQLATDVAWAGCGVGTGLLRHALDRSVEAARLVGGRALVDRR